MQTSCGAPQRGGKPRHTPGEQAHPLHPTPCPPYLRQKTLEPEEGSKWNQRPHPDEVCRINTGRQKAELDPPHPPLALMAGRRARVGRVEFQTGARQQIPTLTWPELVKADRWERTTSDPKGTATLRWSTSPPSLLLPPPRDVNSQLSLKENVLCFWGGLIGVVALNTQQKCPTPPHSVPGRGLGVHLFPPLGLG